MPPVGQPYAPSPIQIMSGPALNATQLPNAEMGQSTAPVTRLSPGYAIRHQPFGPYGRPWTAGRPETHVPQTNGHHARPLTQNSNPDSRPSTANVHHGYVNYMPQPVVGPNHGNMAPMYIPDDRPISSRERPSGVPRQYLGDAQAIHSSPHEASSVHIGMDRLDRSELQESYRMHPNPSYMYPHDQSGVHRHVSMNGQAPPQYTRSPYEPVPLRTQIGSVSYDGALASVPPTPQTMQHTPQGRIVPFHGSSNPSSNPSYTSSGSLNSRHSRRSNLSSSGQPYMQEHGMHQFRSIGPASSSQIAEIYGNSVGAQESPFSYHPPPTATHPPSANTLSGQFEPVASTSQMYYPGPEPVDTSDVAYTMPPHVQSHQTHASMGSSGPQPDMAHYIMSARHQRRRPSLPIESLVDADPSQHAAPRIGIQDSTNEHHALPQETVYYMPYSQTQGQVQGGFPTEMSSAGYSFPNTLPVSGVYQGAVGAASQTGHRPHPHQHQVEWENHTVEDPLVGQMDAKARALLEGTGSGFGV